MMVLDTSAVIELLKGTEKGKEIQIMLAHSTALVTSITVNEALVGEKDNREQVINFLKEINILPFDGDAAWRSVELEEKLYTKGKPLSKLDLYIASICLVNNLLLVSTDKGFQSVEGLKLLLVS